MPKTPWFMHSHRGVNTLVGVYPTPVGAYVRSYKDRGVEVTFYPLGHDFPGGSGRVVIPIGFYTETDGPAPMEAEIDQDVAKDLEYRLSRGSV